MTEQFETASNSEMNVGDKMSDGTIFAGISPETKRPMFVLPQDESLTMSFNEAQKYSRTVEAFGHKDWRVPAPSELNVLYQNKDKGFLRGTFNDSAWYLATPQFHGYNDEPYEQRFRDGKRDWNLPGGKNSVRLVRS